MIVGEGVDDLEKGAQGFRVAVGQVGVVEDVAEEQRDAGAGQSHFKLHAGKMASAYRLRTSWPTQGRRAPIAAIEGHVQRPMQLVLNVPVLTNQAAKSAAQVSRTGKR